jgi:hypothetical protein
VLVVVVAVVPTVAPVLLILLVTMVPVVAKWREIWAKHECLDLETEDLLSCDPLFDYKMEFTSQGMV